MVETYLAQKVAERWLGGPLPGFSTLDMEFGKIREEEALPFYELSFSETITRVGLVTDDAGKIGCSPDGLLDPDGGLEVKCPNPDTHVKYLLADELPENYAAQVHFSLYVTGRKWWKFFSYRRNFPPFVTAIERDEKIMATIEETLAAFIPRLDAAYARLYEMNGGPPKRAAIRTVPKNETNENDIGH